MKQTLRRFSGLNNLKDITLIPEYSALCGYTRNELEAVFVDYLESLDLDEMRTWYNGYTKNAGKSHLSWLVEKLTGICKWLFCLHIMHYNY